MNNQMNMMNNMNNYMNMNRLSNMNMNNRNNLNMNNLNNNMPNVNNQINNFKRTTHFLNPNYNGQRFNIDFKTTTGQTVLMSVPSIATVGEIIKEFCAVSGIMPDDKKVKFVFNAKKIKDEEKNITAQDYGFTDLSTVVVLDAIVIGA